MKNVFSARKHFTVAVANLFLAITISTSASAQLGLANGNYTFSNEIYILTFTIMDDGFSILNTNLINKLTGQVETQTGGEFFRTNPHTTRFAYWYQFQTTACYYNFDVPKKILKLERFDCKDKEIRAANIVLRKN